MRRISLALFASLATLAFAAPAAAEEAPKADDKAPASSTTAPAPVPVPAGEKPTSKSIEENNRDFLGKGSLIIGAERVFGFAQTSQKTEGSDAVKSTQWGILWGAPTSVYQVPRMAIDYVAFDQVTFGGAVGIAHSSYDAGGSSTNLLIAPRAGYIFGGRGVLSLWARAGFTFFSTSAGTGGGGSVWGTAFNIEPEIIISPYKHLGIYLGAVVDLGMFGKETFTSNGSDTKLSSTVTNYGVTSGLRAWF